MGANVVRKGRDIWYESVYGLLQSAAVIFTSIYALLSEKSEKTEAVCNFLTGCGCLFTTYLAFKLFLCVHTRICIGEFYEPGHPTVYLWKHG